MQKGLHCEALSRFNTRAKCAAPRPTHALKNLAIQTILPTAEDPMATMNVSLPDPMKDWVETQTRGGKFANSSDYVRHLIRQDQDRAEAMARLHAALDEGERSGIVEDFDFGEFKARMRAEYAGRKDRAASPTRPRRWLIWTASGSTWSRLGPTHRQTDTWKVWGGPLKPSVLFRMYPYLGWKQTPVRIRPVGQHLIVYLVQEELKEIVQVLGQRQNRTTNLA